MENWTPKSAAFVCVQECINVVSLVKIHLMIFKILCQQSSDARTHERQDT